MNTRGKRRIWVVDDSPLEAAHAQRCLREKYDVDVFADGSSALEALGQHAPPDVLVLDWIMPGVTGIDVCRFLRSTGGDTHVAILLLTSHQRTEQIVEGLSAGANDFVSKPYVEAELVARVDALMRSRELLERAERAEAAVLDLLTHTPDALLACNEGRVVTFANAKAGSVFGERAERLIGRDLHGLVPEFAADAAFSATPPAALPDLTIDGREYAVSTNRVFQGGKRLDILSLRDVTDQRRAQSRRLDLYSIVAHDLRSPLNTLNLRNEILLESSRQLADKTFGEYLTKNQSNIRALVALINDFLEVARLEGGSLPTRKERVDLVALVRQVADDFDMTAKAARVTLSTTGPSSAPVMGDRRRLEQVLTNLVSNALKFTRPGGSVATVVEVLDGSVVVRVVDTGRGVAPALIPALFQRYSRARDAHPDVEGTGLGLMIVRDIVEALGGSVGVESEVGRGSTFHFRLPSAPAAAPLS